MIKPLNVLNLNKILESKNMPNWVLLAAFELTQSNYLTAGDYFEKLDDVEVYEIKNAVDYIKTDNFHQFNLYSEQAMQDLENLSLLCFILALGEGEPEMTQSALSSMLEYLFLLVNIENNYREGKVDVIRNNYSLLTVDKPVVKHKG